MRSFETAKRGHAVVKLGHQLVARWDVSHMDMAHDVYSANYDGTYQPPQAIAAANISVPVNLPDADVCVKLPKAAANLALLLPKAKDTMAMISGTASSISTWVRRNFRSSEGAEPRSPRH